VLNAEISAHFSGNVFDKETVSQTDGFFDSANNQIVWSQNTNRELSSIPPGGKGRVSFSFVPSSVLGMSQSIRDPQVVIEVSIKGQEPGSDTGTSEVTNFEKKIVRI